MAGRIINFLQSSPVIAFILSLLVIMIALDLTVTGKGLHMSLMEKPEVESDSELDGGSGSSPNRKNFLKVIADDFQDMENTHSNNGDDNDNEAVKPDVGCAHCGGFTTAECSHICGSRGFPHFYCQKCECLCHHGVDGHPG